MAEEREKQAPKCELLWEENHFVVQCETPEDRDRAVKALEEAEVVVKVKVKKERGEKE